MKKIFLIALVALMLSGCSSTKGKITEVSSIEAIEQIEDGKDILLVVGTTTCPACLAYDKVIEEYVKNYDFEINKLLIDNEPTVEVEVNGEMVEKRADFEKFMEVVGPIEATPTTLVIVDGEVVQTKIGMLEYRDLSNLINKYFND